MLSNASGPRAMGKVVRGCLPSFPASSEMSHVVSAFWGKLESLLVPATRLYSLVSHFAASARRAGSEAEGLWGKR